MNILALLIVAFGGAFSVVWLIHYIPLRSKVFGRRFSPRLVLCSLLAPFDAMVTLLLVAGAWTGLITSITGIGMMIYNVLTGIGLSVGVVFVKKVLYPKWKQEYEGNSHGPAQS
jgi:hypothetical protein